MDGEWQEVKPKSKPAPEPSRGARAPGGGGPSSRGAGGPRASSGRGGDREARGGSASTDFSSAKLPYKSDKRAAAPQTSAGGGGARREGGRDGGRGNEAPAKATSSGGSTPAATPTGPVPGAPVWPARQNVLAKEAVKPEGAAAQANPASSGAGAPAATSSTGGGAAGAGAASGGAAAGGGAGSAPAAAGSAPHAAAAATPAAGAAGAPATAASAKAGEAEARARAEREKDEKEKEERELKEKEERERKEKEEEEKKKDALTSAHPLKHKWAMWFKRNQASRDKKKSWDTNTIEKLAIVSTVEEFWSLLHHIKTPSWHPEGSSYHFFRDGIEPAWEDVANAQGGSWKVMVDRSLVESNWQLLLMECVGNLFPREDTLCGVGVSIRPQNGDRFEIWTRDAADSEAVMEVGKHLRNTFKIPSTTKITYTKHIKNKSTSFVNDFEA